MEAQERILLEVKTPKVYDTEEVYLDWCNNYLTVEVMSEHYGLTTKQMNTLICNGRQVNIDKYHAKKGTESTRTQILNLINKK
jgi:hypothetical protein